MVAGALVMTAGGDLTGCSAAVPLAAGEPGLPHAAAPKARVEAPKLAKTGRVTVRARRILRRWRNDQHWRMGATLQGRARGHMGLTLQIVGALKGSDVLFFSLVFLHAIVALIGFGSVGFAGTYASRAAQIPLAAWRPRGAVRSVLAGEAPGATPIAGHTTPSMAGQASPAEPGAAPRAPGQADAGDGSSGTGAASSGTGAAGAASSGTGAAGAAILPPAGAILTGRPVAPGPDVQAEPAAQLLAEQEAEEPPDAATAGPSTGDTPEPPPGPHANEAGMRPGAGTRAADLDPEIEELTRYFDRPARFALAIVLVPVFGVLALWAQPNGHGFDQVWTVAAMCVWAFALLIVGGLVVPGLRTVRELLGQLPSPQSSAAVETAWQARLSRAGMMASRGAIVCDLLFCLALAFMIWQP
ncbi:MAG TPA: hypothetical protein VME46_26180 [Acidimicrobiales bacterium]|nr:hypothetical protein [Acidimicrobiales bacterium]